MKVALLAGVVASCMVLSVSAQQTDTTRRTGRSQQNSKSQQKKPTQPATSRQAGSATDRGTSRAAGTAGQADTSGRRQSDTLGRRRGSRQTDSLGGRRGGRQTDNPGRMRGGSQTDTLGRMRSGTQTDSPGRMGGGTQTDSLGRTPGGRQTDSLTGRGGRQVDSSRIGRENRQTDTTESGIGTLEADTSRGGQGKPNSDALRSGTNGQIDALQQKPPVQQTSQAQAAGGTYPTQATPTGATSGNQQGDKIGSMTVTEFNNINLKGNQMVKAITPARGTMSQADQQLLIQVANGGHRQLALSQAVMEKVNNPQVKMLAASEVEEQMGVAMKLKEIAGAMGVTLPANRDSSGQNITARIQNLSGAQIDSFYLEEGGIKGHELLQQTMTTVSSTAKNAALKQLANATLPVIKTHLTVSREVRSSLQSGARSN